MYVSAQDAVLYARSGGGWSMRAALTNNVHDSAVNVAGHYEINPWKSLNGAISRILNGPGTKFRGARDSFGPLNSMSDSQNSDTALEFLNNLWGL